jgi:CelD/BcsL family acetyltransferase involved in cellulose biosynthesis
MRTEVCTQREALTAVAPRWDELARLDRRDGLFRSSGWYTAWLDHVRRDASPYVVLAYHEGQVVGIAPLCRMPYPDLGFRLNAVSSAGREIVSGDYLGFPALPEYRAGALHAIFNALWERREDWDLLIVGEVEEGSDLDQAAESFANSHNLPFRCQEPRICPFISLPATFDEYLAGLSSNMRYKVRRDERDILGKLGGRVEVLTQPAEVRAGLQTLVRLHVAHWNRLNEPGTLNRPGIVNFLEEMSSDAGARLYLLHGPKHAEAALISFVFGDTMMYYQMGWDPDSIFVPCRPGYYLLSCSIRDAIQSKLRYFDFLRGDETYKTRFTQTFRKTHTVLAGRTLKAQAYLSASRLKDSVKRILPAAEAGQAERSPMWKS